MASNRHKLELVLTPRQIYNLREFITPHFEASRRFTSMGEGVTHRALLALKTTLDEAAEKIEQKAKDEREHSGDAEKSSVF